MKHSQDILAYLGEHKKARTIFMRFFHGNGKYAGELQEKTGKEKSGYDCGKVIKGRRRRFCGRHECCHHDY